MSKKVLITGAPGQDSFWLSKYLLTLDYDVYISFRYSSQPTEERFKQWGSNFNNVKYLCLDVLDSTTINKIVKENKFDEIYNLATMSHVGQSFKVPEYAIKVNSLPALYFLEAIRLSSPSTKYYHALTSECWGSNYTIKDGKKVQNEQTPFSPNSPYGVGKLAAYHTVRLYREAYNLKCCAGFLHNHESEIRGKEFFTRKVTSYVANLFNFIRENKCEYYSSDEHLIKFKSDKKIIEYPKLRLGNINSVRDFCHASDVVRAMHLMLNKEGELKDYVVASGVGTKMKDFLEMAFDDVGIKDYDNYWTTDPKFYRPREVEFLQGDASLIKEELGWEPTISVDELVNRMILSDVNLPEIKI